jgi:hypothetical protein
MVWWREAFSGVGQRHRTSDCPPDVVVARPLSEYPPPDRNLLSGQNKSSFFNSGTLKSPSVFGTKIERSISKFISHYLFFHLTTPTRASGKEEMHGKKQL